MSGIMMLPLLGDTALLMLVTAVYGLCLSIDFLFLAN